MQGFEEQAPLVGIFDDLAQIHHGDAAADVLDHGKIVGDEQIGQMLLALQVHHQVDHLRADRDVERGDRLVGDDQLGVERERAGDADALALPAGELMREARHLRGGKPDQLEQLGDALAASGLRQPVNLQRLADDVPRRHARIERGERILKDDLHLAPVRPQLALAQMRDVTAADLDGPGGRLDQAEHGPGQGRFPAAAFADEPEGLAARNREAHPVERQHLPHGPAQQALLHREMFLEILDLGPQARQRRLPLPGLAFGCSERLA